jgi:hypothetical protein
MGGTYLVHCSFVIKNKKNKTEQQVEDNDKDLMYVIIIKTEK